ncbi:GAF domain-containing protein [Nocardiopsis sp. Huas11]|uniref:PP2C family protein-serine/threonine phosphatase n=1 Tax=Nocardiopsis sp. Huas11 TaxID=2183912 RepID=UPI000EABF26D|nr:GAF domain-containing SpoIIE family protein phosphatase [Nocardiopsis sp. Huas11]RKS04692.1 GAF domain-containing protein [Nocardiopsis sp. Huas11]
MVPEDKDNAASEASAEGGPLHRGAAAVRWPVSEGAGSLPGLGEDPVLTGVAEQVQELVRTQVRMRSLLSAVLALGQDLELGAVLRRVVAAAMELVGARYGALGILNDHGDGFAEFIPLGLDEEEERALAGVDHPSGKGLLGSMIHRNAPLRVDDIGAHPDAVGFPAGHPAMRSLLGAAVKVRGRTYGDIYVSTRRDGRPFDRRDEEVLTALAGAAGIAIENARLFEEVRTSAERFQRLLLPRVPDLAPFEVASVYRPADAGLGGDWYDALRLRDGACVAVIGDVIGHDLVAAASMARIRSKLRALVYDRHTSPGAALSSLDRILLATEEDAVTTISLARIEPVEDRWDLCWSTAGHLPPLVLAPGGDARYLEAEPGLPLGVDPDAERPDHRYPMRPSSTVLMFTDGLVEHPDHSLDRGLGRVAEIAAAYADRPVADLCRAVTEDAPGDGHDDLAVLAVRVPQR